MHELIEPLQFIKKIHKAGIRYLLIGRQAVIAYGGPVQSMDYDIYIDGSKENTKRFLEIAEEFDLMPNIPEGKLYTTFKFKLENNFILDVFRAKTMALSKDKKISFDAMYERKVILKGETSLEVNVPAIKDLIFLKKFRSLPKDLQDIKYLEALDK